MWRLVKYPVRIEGDGSMSGSGGEQVAAVFLPGEAVERRFAGEKERAEEARFPRRAVEIAICGGKGKS